MADKTKRKYTSLEERLRIGKLVTERGQTSMKTLAAELGYPEGNLFSWQNLYRNKKNGGTALVHSEDKDAIIVKLRATLAEQEDEIVALQEQVATLQRITMAVGRQLK